MSNARDLSKFLQEGGEVDTDTLVVDSTNNRVGIGTTSQSAPLEVNVSGASDALILTRDTGTNGELQIDFNGANASHNSVQGGHTFATNGTERMRILSSGGITFNGDTAAANALDDYEEGTWTPTLGGSSSNPTVSYSSLRSGTYVKIGKLVYCTFIMDIASCSGGSGTAVIAGLPYTVENNNASYGNQPLLIDRLAGDYRQVSSQPSPNGSWVSMIRNAGSTGSHAGVDVSTLANMSCRGTIIYRAS